MRLNYFAVAKYEPCDVFFYCHKQPQDKTVEEMQNKGDFLVLVLTCLDYSLFHTIKL